MEQSVSEHSASELGGLIPSLRDRVAELGRYL